MVEERLSEKLDYLKDEIAKVQLGATEKGYNLDMERIVILLESAVSSLIIYENS